jgi:hypothetical protein
LLVGEFVAECYWTGVSEADLDALDARVEASLSPDGIVRYRGSMLVPEDEVVFCFFHAPSSRAARSAAERARVPFARIVEARHFVFADPPAGGGAAPSDR